MVQSLQLTSREPAGVQRVNRLPLVVIAVLLVTFLAVIFYGLSSRGLSKIGNVGIEGASDGSASSYAEQLKKGISDGIIGEPAVMLPAQAPPLQSPEIAQSDEGMVARHKAGADMRPEVERETEQDWLQRLAREHRQQRLRERQRHEMARLQAHQAAFDSPLTVDIAQRSSQQFEQGTDLAAGNAAGSSAKDLYSAALDAAIGDDRNRQSSKQAFLNADIKELGYLPNQVVPAQSPYELKRGSVIPATLITGIVSDLPGRISAQVSQPVFDSATGRHLLIPQGARLFGRYDSDVTFGQSRVLVVWTDLIFPNGSTLQIGGMAGTDAAGNGGFRDKVDRHLLRTFGSAALIAMIGAGMDMSMPQDRTEHRRDSASDAVRRSFSETFGRMAERTIGKNLDVQPTLRIRPGYRFNVLVDQDIVFPGAFR
ncbi:Type IV secretion system protein PtlG [Ensifer adhaerens]|uniref:IncP-type conjugal transfer protein TrbI n=1 Tax=Ensifer adhaerens TaxID=106592 RepID=UPI001568EEE8|nr:IncP-type conjugal transfer protein TrbI [Ensifer adhaerens]NRP21816.1 Type IV secretion system protein PtlG [Ensifer adhaerens]